MLLLAQHPERAGLPREQRAETETDGGRGSSVAFEELDGALVSLGRGACPERSEISTPSRLRILLPRIEPVPSRRQLANHGVLALSVAYKKQTCIAFHRPAGFAV